MTIYGAGATKIGDAVWDKKPFDYTDTEYNTAFEAIQKRLVKVDNKEYFPLVKGSLVPYETSLIAKTIYGNRITKSFRDNTLGYKQLQEDTINGVRDNKLIALDGRKLFLRSQHKALNLLIQSAGAIFMKYLLFFVEKEFSKRWTHGKEYAYVANIHDAINIEIIPEIKDEVRDILVSSFTTTSNHFNFNYPVKGNPHFGANQWETH